MNTGDTFIKILCNRIKKGRFNWGNYQNGGRYCIPKVHSANILTQRVVCSYGLCGFEVTFPYSNLPAIQWDCELRELTVDGTDYKTWLYWAEHYEAYYNEWLKADTEFDFSLYVKEKYSVDVPEEVN